MSHRFSNSRGLRASVSAQALWGRAAKSTNMMTKAEWDSLRASIVWNYIKDELYKVVMEVVHEGKA